MGQKPGKGMENVFFFFFQFSKEFQIDFVFLFCIFKKYTQYYAAA
jgi:hypothetical protein